jgi:hypothetical protein
MGTCRQPAGSSACSLAKHPPRLPTPPARRAPVCPLPLLSVMACDLATSLTVRATRGFVQRIRFGALGWKSVHAYGRPHGVIPIVLTVAIITHGSV